MFLSSMAFRPEVQDTPPANTMPPATAAQAQAESCRQPPRSSPPATVAQAEKRRSSPPGRSSSSRSSSRRQQRPPSPAKQVIRSLVFLSLVLHYSRRQQRPPSPAKHVIHQRPPSPANQVAHSQVTTQCYVMIVLNRIGILIKGKQISGRKQSTHSHTSRS